MWSDKAKPLLVVLCALVIPNAASGEVKGETSPPPQVKHSKKPASKPIRVTQRVTQEFGENPAMYKQFGVKGHTGRDIGQDCGEPVKSPASGVVKVTGYDPKGYGNFVVIQDNLGYQHILGHYQSLNIKRGQYVDKDSVTGKTGSSGLSSGCHEHWGVRGAERDNGFAGYIDPRKWISMREKRESQKTCVYDVPKVYADVICRAVKKHPTNPAVLAAILFWEHRGFEEKPYEYKWRSSPVGASGPSQIMPGTWKAYADDGNGDGVKDIQNLDDAIFTAAHYLSANGKVKGVSSDPTAAQVSQLAVIYNCGGGCANPNNPETAPYRKAVVNLWWKFGSN